MIRVLHVESACGGIGGSHVSLEILLRHFNRERLASTVLLLEDGPYRQRIEALGVPTVVVSHRSVDRSSLAERLAAAVGGQASVAPSFYRIAADTMRLTADVLPGAALVAAAVKRVGADLVHANDRVGSNGFALVGALLAGVPCVVQERFIYRYRPLDRALSSLSALTICISHAVERSCLAEGHRGRNLQVVHNPVEVGEVQASLPPNGHFRVAMVGRLVPWKGQDLFLEAGALLRRGCPELDLYLIGGTNDPEFERRLRARAAERDLAGAVHMVGFLEDPGPLAASMDVLVHYSRTPEPLGLVVLEGMALGKPVLAAAEGGPLETVEDGVTGLLVPPRDTQALASGLARLLADADLRRRLGQAAWQRVRSQFDPSAYADRIEALFRGVLGC